MSKIKSTPPPQGEAQTQFAVSMAAAPVAEVRSNAEGTCLWCGRKLKPVGESTRPAATNAGLKPRLLLGAYADGRFCKMRCAYAFAVWAAHLGFRLAPREAPIGIEPDGSLRVADTVIKQERDGVRFIHGNVKCRACAGSGGTSRKVCEVCHGTGKAKPAPGPAIVLTGPEDCTGHYSRPECRTPASCPTPGECFQSERCNKPAKPNTAQPPGG